MDYTASERTNKIIAGIFLLLFALPFCGFGLAAFFKGLGEIVSGGSSQYWGLMMIGLVFAAIGFTFLTALILGPRKMKQINRRKAENPDKPWLWRDDWAQGRAISKTRSSMISAWIFAVLLNLISVPAFLLIPKGQLVARPQTLVALLFPLLGIGLLVWAIRETLRWLEFGKNYFEMASVPCVLGRELRGTIQTHFPHTPNHSIRLKLSCVAHIVSRTGSSHNSQDKILLRLEKAVSPNELSPGPAGTAIPVSFRLPVGALQTDSNDPNNKISWLLEADADVPGVDYREIFELPVFHTAATPSTEEVSASETHPERPEAPSIRVGISPEGGTEFYFPAARNPGFACTVTAVTGLWAGIVWLIVTQHAPMIFAVVFGLFGLLMIYWTLQAWLGTSRVVIGAGVVNLRSGLLGGGRVQQIPFSQISTIRALITSQTGGANGTPYYDIQLIGQYGKVIRLGQMVRSKQEVDWLVAEMIRLIALKKQNPAHAAAR